MKEERYPVNELIEISTAFYIDGLSQKEIAAKYFLSKSKVSRMLKKALENNIVNITINHKGQRNLVLEETIKNKFNIKTVIVINNYQTENEKASKDFYEFTGSYIDDLLHDDTYIGIGSGASLNKIIDAMKQRITKNSIKTVQIIGVPVKEKEYKYDSQLLVRKLAAKLNAEAHLLFSPLYIENPIVKSLLLEENIIKQSIKAAKMCDIVLTSVSADINPKHSKPSEWSSYISKKRLEELHSKSIVGIVLSHFINYKGEIADKELDSKIIGLSIDDLKEVSNMILVAFESKKALGLYCALKTNAIDTLIIPSLLAKKLMEIEI